MTILSQRANTEVMDSRC